MEQAVATRDGMDIIDVESTDLIIRRDPAEVLIEARKAAVALNDVISKKSKPVIFNGEQYLEFEDWQTVGRFYGITAKIVSTEPVTFGAVSGFLARAVAIHGPSGREVSAAEAMCLDDEDKWKSRTKYEWCYAKKSGGHSVEDPGKDEIIWVDNPKNPGRKAPKKERIKTGEERVPLFQLRSMSQTRACAKALRNVLAWVVVLAGYRPTPAEELQIPDEPPDSKSHSITESAKTQVAESEQAVKEMFKKDEPTPIHHFSEARPDRDTDMDILKQDYDERLQRSVNFKEAAQVREEVMSSDLPKDWRDGFDYRFKAKFAQGKK